MTLGYMASLCSMRRNCQLCDFIQIGLRVGLMIHNLFFLTGFIYFITVMSNQISFIAFAFTKYTVLIIVFLLNSTARVISNQLITFQNTRTLWCFSHETEIHYCCLFQNCLTAEITMINCILFPSL